MARKDILSDMIGTVWKVEVETGDQVGAGDTLMVLQSMKMEIPVESTVSGRVVEILVKEEDAVEEGQVVAVIDA